MGSATPITIDFGAIFPFTCVPAYSFPVYASQRPLPDATQDSVRGCWLGFAAVAISGACASRAFKAQPPPDLAFGSAGLNPDSTPLDNNFVGFQGRVAIDWPEWNARLEMAADPIYACLVVYTPAGRDFFCVEPATNYFDGFNLAEDGRTDTGIIVLEPRDTAVGDVAFTPRVGA